jgi:S-layer homology domain
MVGRKVAVLGLLFAASLLEAQVGSPTAVNVHAYAFRQTYSADLVIDDGNGYRYLGPSPVSRWMAAPLQLPTGVVIESLVFSYCAHQNGDLLLTLFDNGVGGGGSGGGTPIVSVTAAAGCGLASAEPPGGSYAYLRTVSHPLYLVIYFAGDEFDGSTKFNDVWINYHPVKSPVPAEPSFDDVPIGHPFYQHIELLKYAGITAGCSESPPLFCPNRPLTRGEMAVYLSIALGLHWPF